MQNLEKWSMEVFSIVAVIISFCALSLTIYDSFLKRKSFREQTYQGFVGTWFDLGRIFIDYPELRAYFYDNHPLSNDDANYQRIMAICVFFDDCFAYTESQAVIIPDELQDSYYKYKEKIKSMDAFIKYKENYTWINSRSI